MQQSVSYRQTQKGKSTTTSPLDLAYDLGHCSTASNAIRQEKKTLQTVKLTESE